MSRLQQCIDALEALKDDKMYGIVMRTSESDRAINSCIATISHILSAEPTSEEIERAAQSIVESDMQCISKNKSHFKYGRPSRMTLGEMASFSARAALLTAFPQQEKI